MNTLKKLRRQARELIIYGFTNISDDPLAKDTYEVEPRSAKNCGPNTNQHGKLEVRAHLILLTHSKASTVISNSVCFTNKPAIRDNFNG